MKLPALVVDALSAVGMKGEVTALLRDKPLSPELYDKIAATLNDGDVAIDIPTTQIILALRQLRNARRRRMEEQEASAGVDTPDVDIDSDDEDDAGDFPLGSVPNYLEVAILRSMGYQNEVEDMLNMELADEEVYKRMIESVEDFQGRQIFSTNEMSLLMGKIEDLIAV